MGKINGGFNQGMKKWKTTLGIICADVVLCSACENKNMAKGTAPASS